MAYIRYKEIIVKKYNKYTYGYEFKAAAISSLAGDIWREHYPPIIGAAQVEYMLAKFQSADQIRADIRENGYTYFTAKHIERDKLVGYAACKPEDGYLLLSKIYVHKDYRGNRISRSFLEEAASLCREYGFDKIRLTVNKNNETAIAVYRKMGFNTVDSIKTDIGEGYFMDDYVMERVSTAAT